MARLISKKDVEVLSIGGLYEEKAGVTPSLVRKGLVEVYKKPVSTLSGKKCKFLCVGMRLEEDRGEPWSMSAFVRRTAPDLLNNLRP